MRHLLDMRRTFPQIPTRDAIMGLAQPEKVVKQRKQASQLSTRVSLAVRPGAEPLGTVLVTLPVTATVADCLAKAMAMFAAMPHVAQSPAMPTWDPSHLCVSFADESGRLVPGSPPELPPTELVRSVLRACHPLRAAVTLRHWYLETEAEVEEEQAGRARHTSLWYREHSRLLALGEQWAARARQKERSRLDFERGVEELGDEEGQGRARVVAAEEEARPLVEQLFRDVFREHVRRTLLNLARLRRLRAELKGSLDEASALHDSIEDDDERVDAFPLQQLMPQLPTPGDPLSAPCYPPSKWRKGPGRFRASA